MSSTAERLVAKILPVRVPDIDGLNTIGRLILLVEASSCLAPYLDRRDQFGKDVLALLDQGRLIPGTDYVQAQRLRRLMQAEFRKLFEGIDCLLTPTTPLAAPRIGQTTIKLGDAEEDTRLASTRFVRGINVLGLPALSIPCGVDSENMPLSLQIIGRPFEEDVILKI
jgi:aspartyl-tRNA(Asn)/glutamyl-tRNA(Gln) amidotransferase subunit A